MKWICVLLLLTMLNHSSIAQINLVPNGSFEDTLKCPVYYNQIDRAIGWSAYRLTPDYFNSCNTTYVGVPTNDAGFQYARTGSAYAGFISYAKFTKDYRECLGIALLQQLNIGQTYFIRCFLSLAIGTIGHTYFATNKLGIKFSTTPYLSLTNPIPVTNFAHLYSDSVYTDSTNWVEISGYFTADSAYQFISIGNFFNDSLTTHISYDSLAAFAYYYVDDISVIDSTTTGLYENSAPVSNGITQSIIQNEILFVEKDIKSILIFDASGRKCLEISSADFVKSINVKSLKSGMYFIKYITSKNFFVKKIIKK